MIEDNDRLNIKESGIKIVVKFLGAAPMSLKQSAWRSDTQTIKPF